MKKVITIITLLTVCICSFAGCSNKTQSAPNGMKVLESSDNLDYSLYIPEVWIQDLSTGAVSAYYSSSDLSNISMTQFNLDELKPLEEYTKDYIKDLEENLNDFKMSEGFPENIILGGVAAEKIEYTATLSGNTYKYSQIICINKATIYFFTYTALEDAFDSHKEDVQMMIDNFSFR